ncbi:GGDEF domain-containing protein [Deinococcus knuensis]|uniref:GGDEF domain-containing protein n=1 Tax=Deinococcus knuensis TaxID=1837380 RepID=UPI001662A2BE|nr:GGDEF domain-containing protein [Deinococcus knuensis]
MKTRVPAADPVTGRSPGPAAEAGEPQVAGDHQPAALNLDSAEFAYRRGSLLTLLGAVLIVSVITLSVQASWEVTLTDQALLAALAVKNAALFWWLWRSPRALRAVGLIELAIQSVTVVLRLYLTLHSPPGYHGLGGFAPWMIFSYLVAFLVLPGRQAATVTGVQFMAMLAVIAGYSLNPQIDPAMKAGLGNSLLQTVLMHATFIAYLALQQRLLGQFVNAVLHARQEATLAQLDVLTGLPNRRQLSSWLDEWLTREPPATPEPLSVILFDLDHFKRVNDTYGHDVGDEVLRHVANILRRSVCQGDRVGRWGGEEFLILVPGDAQAAQVVADRLRQNLRRTPHLRAGVQTVSCGVAQAHAGERTSDLLRRADEAMYAAKNAGRDTVSIAV